MCSMFFNAFFLTLRDFACLPDETHYIFSLPREIPKSQGDKTALPPRPARSPIPAWDDDDDLFARASAEMQADHISLETDRKQFVENVRQRLMTLDKAVLIGEPGRGKSWMLQRLQADYARAWLKGNRDGRGLVPVLVRLNNYEGGSFTDFVKEALDTLAPYHNRLLSDGRLVLLCDALNEMPRRDQQTQKLIDYLKQAPYFVVSSGCGITKTTLTR